MFHRSTASVTSTSCSSVSVICARTSWLYRVGCRRVTNRGDVKWSFVVYSCRTMCFSCVYCGGGRYLYILCVVAVFWFEGIYFGF